MLHVFIIRHRVNASDLASSLFSDLIVHAGAPLPLTWYTIVLMKSHTHFQRNARVPSQNKNLI
jgi:hypothetical protein